MADQWPDSPPVAFAYGLALADTGRKEEARKVLASVDLATTSVAEAELLKEKLK